MGRSDETDMEEVLQTMFGPGVLADENVASEIKDRDPQQVKSGYTK